VEKRSEIRIHRGAQILVQITDCAQDTGLVGALYECSSLDLSLSGVKIKSSDEIPSGSRLDIWLDLKPEPRKYHLMGDVCWTKRMAQHGDVYNLGIHLRNSCATDIEEWQKI